MKIQNQNLYVVDIVVDINKVNAVHPESSRALKIQNASCNDVATRLV
jgi:hypothetical protein